MCVKKAERASRLFYFTEKEVRKIKKIADSPYNPPPKKKGEEPTAQSKPNINNVWKVIDSL